MPVKTKSNLRRNYAEDVAYIRMTLGKRICARRLELKMHQRVLADIVGMHQTDISKIESGNERAINMQIIRLMEIAHALGIDPCHLLRGLHL